MDQTNASRNPYVFRGRQAQDTGGSARPLPFPEADREFQRETIGLSGRSRNLTRGSGSSPPSSLFQHADGMSLPILPAPYPTYGMFSHPNGSTPSPSERQRGSDQTQNIRVTIPSPLRVPMASPEIEMDDNYNMNMGSAGNIKSKAGNGTSTSLPLTVHPAPEEPRYFFSLRTLLELLSLLAAMIPMAVAPHWGAYQRGFFCNDPYLMYPFHEGTVKPWLLYLICLTLPFITVLVGEICHFHVSKTGYGDMEVKYRIWKKGPVVPPVLVSLTRIVVLFTYGFLITKSVTDIAKYSVGRLRPHFLDVCRPNMTLIAIDGGCNRYITEAHCSTVNSTDPKVQYRLRDSRLSFLSGHAAMAFYSMFFVIFYLESRLRWMDLRYCKAIIQFGLFLMAALTGLSRISDHKHHWTDVFAGAALGLIMCIVTVFSIGGFFNDSHYLRYKLVAMLQKLDWSHEEGGQFARLLGASNGRDPRVLRTLKHFTRQQYPKSA